MASEQEKIQAIQKAMADIQMAVREITRPNVPEQTTFTEPTMGWTVQVKTEKLARFKDTAIDLRKKLYEAADEMIDLWLDAVAQGKIAKRARVG